MDNPVLALDLGTSSLHCMLADSLGTPIVTASSSMSYHTPEGCSQLARQFDPHEVVRSVGTLISKVLSLGHIEARSISAVGITSQRHGMVFLDKEGAEVYSGPSIDLRAVFEGAAMDEELGEEVYLVTGHFPSLLLAPARLSWFRDHLPRVYEKTTAILSIGGWLAYKLTGSLLSEPSLDGELGLLDIRTGQRCPGFMDRVGVPSRLLPPLSYEGCLAPQPAGLWGLKAGIPVVVAGPDTQCGLLGMGLAREGLAGAVVGWSGAVQVLTPSPCYDSKMRTWVGRHPWSNLWVAEANLGEAGVAYGWLKDLLLGNSASFLEAEQLAKSSCSASEGVTAFLGPGPETAARAGSRMGSLLFPTPFSLQTTSQGQLLRAALENVAYSIKANLDTLEDVTSINPSTLSLGGGMADSRTLASILANVLGFSVRRSTLTQVSTRGAAFAATVAANSFGSIQGAAEGGVKLYDEVEPGSPAMAAQYKESYQRWLHLYDRMGWE